MTPVGIANVADNDTDAKLFYEIIRPSGSGLNGILVVLNGTDIVSISKSFYVINQPFAFHHLFFLFYPTV